MTKADDFFPAFRLEGKRAMITGAGGGIGRVLVGVFRSAGASIVGADLEESAMDGLELADRLAFDLTDADAAEKAVAALERAGGGPTFSLATPASPAAKHWRKSIALSGSREIAINLTGAFNIASPVIEAMAGRGDGAVVFIASVNALAHYGNPAYSAAKAGLVAYAKAIARRARRERRAGQCGVSRLRANARMGSSA